MAAKTKRKAQENPALDMTPMIDVVFELMIFFVVTIKQNDIFSKLNANRPAPNTSSSAESNDTQIKIDVGVSGFTFNGRGIRKAELDRNLRQIAGTSKSATVIVRCTLDSQHGNLVYVLDCCNKHGLRNISIFSL